MRGVNDGLRISLLGSYTRHIMPANHERIPTPDMARMWPHLEPIASHLEPLRSCEIGTFIGLTVLEPWFLVKNFAEFITQESKIACDPVTSLQSLRGSGSSYMAQKLV